MKQKLLAGRTGLVRAYARTRTAQTTARFKALTATVEPENARMYARRQNRLRDIWCGLIDFAIAGIDIALAIIGLRKDH